MRLRPIEHLENPKMHTQERQLTCFFCILQLIYKQSRLNVFGGSGPAELMGPFPPLSLSLPFPLPFSPLPYPPLRSRPLKSS